MAMRFSVPPARLADARNSRWILVGDNFQQLRASAQCRIQLSIRGDFFSWRMRAKQGERALAISPKTVCSCAASPSLSPPGWDQVGTPLQYHVHLGPRGVHRFAFHHHLISDPINQLPSISTTISKTAKTISAIFISASTQLDLRMRVFYAPPFRLGK